MVNQELIQSISLLSNKIDGLLRQQKKLREKVNKLELQNQELQLLHQQDKASLLDAQKKIEFLSLSHRLADSPEALIQARNNVSRLIRTIDKCIQMINED